MAGSERCDRLESGPRAVLRGRVCLLGTGASLAATDSWWHTEEPRQGWSQKHWAEKLLRQGATDGGPVNVKSDLRVLQPQLQCINVKPIFIETKGYNTDRKVPGVKVALLVLHRKKGSERQNGTMQKVPLSINNFNRGQYIKISPVPRYPLKRSPMRSTNAPQISIPNNATYKTTNNVNEKDYRGFSQGMFVNFCCNSW